MFLILETRENDISSPLRRRWVNTGTGTVFSKSTFGIKVPAKPPTNSSKTENMQKFQSAFTHPVFSTAKIRPARMTYTQNARPETPKPDFKMQHRTRNRIFTVSEVSQIMMVRENIFRHRLKLNQQWPQNRLIWSWLSVYILLEQSFGHFWNHT